VGIAAGVLLIGALVLAVAALGSKAAGAVATSSSTTAGTAGASTSTVPSASLTGIPGSPGPVANSFVPATSWNPLGKPIADWIVPVLQWASQNGWTGTVTSGYRSYAEQLAINQSGAFSATAGQSNHETTGYPGGAVDVTDSAQLIAVLAKYTGAQKLIGGVLGAVDPEHFSATGH
jgi:hypothetical protein